MRQRRVGQGQPSEALDFYGVARKNLRDASGFWITLAAVPLAVAAIAITIAITEYHPPWKSAWFIVGVVTGVLGCVLGLWSLVLYLAHNHSEQHACPDPAKHAVNSAPQAGAIQAPTASPRPAPSQRAILAAVRARSRSERIAWLRPLLREIAGDLRQAAAGVNRVMDSPFDLDFDSVTSEFNPSDAWTEGRERLARDESLGDLYDSCRDAYGCIERIRLTALEQDRVSSRRSGVEARNMSRTVEDLRAAQVAIEKARTAVQEHLSELDQKQPDQ